MEIENGKVIIKTRGGGFLEIENRKAEDILRCFYEVQNCGFGCWSMKGETDDPNDGVIICGKSFFRNSPQELKERLTETINLLVECLNTVKKEVGNWDLVKINNTLESFRKEINLEKFPKELL